MMRNLISDLCRREYDQDFNQSFRESTTYTLTTIDRLHLECELKEHDGCVNCIEWNQEGNVLASGSDDLKLCLWNPFSKKLLTKLDTKHRGNIFSVKFLPFSNDNILISSAADRVIYVHDVNTKSVLHELRSHRNRVKRLAVANDTPHLFWSSGEDGFILQHDIRCSPNEVTQVLVNYSSCSNSSNHDTLEAKCLAINPARSEYIAVGCNDPFARVYDRRVIHTQRWQTTTQQSEITKCVHEYCPDELNKLNRVIKYYSPGHLLVRLADLKRRYKYYSITYLTFNANGSELLVNLSGEQIYLYDVNSCKSSQFKYNSFQSMLSDLTYEKIHNNNGFVSDEQLESMKKKKYKLPDNIDKLKSSANFYFENGKYFDAINLYNKAIALEPNSPILYGNRAAAYMKRNWDGDMYAAMRDCYCALSIDKEHMKSHFRLARCLYELKWYKEAQECLNQFRKLYPDYSNTNACETLVDEIEKAIRKQTSASSSKAGGGESEKKNGKNGRLSSKKKSSQHDSDDDDDSDEDEQENNEKGGGDNDDSEDERVRKKQKNNRIECNDYENQLKFDSIDYKISFSGHCNVATDIKEASFIGDKFIGAGSDDGCFYIWDRKTTNILKAFKADDSIVNCIQPHPYTCMIATSGIDSDIKIWSPGFEHDSNVINDIRAAAEKNQKQMNQHPVELFFMNIQHSLWDSGGESESPQTVGCRTS